MMRLQRFISQSGVCSRRKAESLIRSGRAFVNGKKITRPGVTVDEEKDVVEVDGVKIEQRKKIYIMLNKPKGVICTLNDELNRPKITDLIDGIKEKVFYIGRLDRDTEGLIILTNDGDFANRHAHPKYEVKRVYDALLKGKISQEKINEIRNGIVLEDGLAAPDSVKLLEHEGGDSRVEIVVKEGRNRMIRRIFEKVGHPVIRLTRTAFGEFRLDGLKSGEYRILYNI